MTDGPHLDETGMHIMGHCTCSQMLKVDVGAYNCWFNPGFHQHWAAGEKMLENLVCTFCQEFVFGAWVTFGYFRIAMVILLPTWKNFRTVL